MASEPTTAITTADIVGAVDGLVPMIVERANDIASARQLPADIVESLRGAGVFRMPMPASWGGPETPLPDQLRIIETLSAADPSVGWCAMIGSDSGFYSSFFDDDVAHQLWSGLDVITAGWLFPAGQARRVQGRYSLSGRWSFGSGCTHADVIVGGFMVLDDSGVPEMIDGLPLMRIAVAPASSFEILDTWHTTGLAGSGSNDYTCTELFVDEAHTFGLGGVVRRPGALYRMPSAFFANVHGVPLGLARRAIDEVIAIAQSKLLLPQFTVMRDVPRVKEAIADAEMLLRSARAYSYAALESVWSELVADRPISPQQRVDLTLSRVQAFRVARDVAQRMVSLAGTQAIYRTSVLDRLLRDAITLNQHLVAGTLMSEGAGGLALGIEPSGMGANLI